MRVPGLPMVDNYRICTPASSTSPNRYKGDWNTRWHRPVFTPADTTIQTPIPTPYSFIGADLRARPLVLTVPKSTRSGTIRCNSSTPTPTTTHRQGPHHRMTAVPACWPVGLEDENPSASMVIRADSDFSFHHLPEPLFDPADLDNVKRIKRVQKHSRCQPSPGKAAATPPVDFITPLTVEGSGPRRSSSDLGFVLKYVPVFPDEGAARSASPPSTSDPTAVQPPTMGPERLQGHSGWNGRRPGRGWRPSEGRAQHRQKVTSADLFPGTHAELGDNYLYRMAARCFGIYGNVAKSPLPVIANDSTEGSTDRRQLLRAAFCARSAPPVHSFGRHHVPDAAEPAGNIRSTLYLVNSPCCPA